MATKQERTEARVLRALLGGCIPASLRYPLLRVVQGTEVPDTAAGILEFAREFARSLRQGKLG